MIVARRRNIYVVLPLIMALTTLGSCGFFHSPDDRVVKAESLLAEGRYREAAIEVRTGLDEAPQDARLHMLLARTALALGAYDSVEKAIADAGAAGADPATLAEVRAQLLLDAGKAAALLEALDERKLVLPDDRRDAWRVLALGSLGRCEELIPPARARLAREPGESATRIVISDCYAGLGNRERALAEIDSGLAVKPDDSRLHMTRAKLLADMNRRPESEASWRRAVEFAPGQLSVPRQVALQLALAEIHVLHDDIAGLRAAHQRLLELAPQAPATEMIGARVQMMQGETVAALNTLRKLASAEGEPPAVHAMLAAGYISQGNFEQARLEISWLQQNSPDLPALASLRGVFDGLANVPADSEEYLLRVGAAQAALGQVDLARKAIAAAESRAPQSTRLAALRVQLELRAGNPEVALELARTLAVANPSTAELAVLHAEALRANGRFAESERIYADLFARAPGVAMALMLHRVRIDGKLPEPNAPLISWLATHPRDVVIRGAYADALRMAGDNRGAMGEYSKVLDVAPNNAVALNNLAWVQYLAKDPRAVATARRAWALAPGASTVADTLGWILVETGEVAEGLPLLAKADAAIGLANPEVRYHHAVALARSGSRDQARALLSDFLPEWKGLAHYDDAAHLLESLREPGGT